MQKEQALGTVDIDDQSFLKHIRDHTDLISRYESAKGKRVSVHDEELTGDFSDFVADEIKNEAVNVESFYREVEMYDGEESFAHNVMEFQGIFFMSRLNKTMWVIGSIEKTRLTMPPRRQTHDALKILAAVCSQRDWTE